MNYNHNKLTTDNISVPISYSKHQNPENSNGFHAKIAAEDAKITKKNLS